MDFDIFVYCGEKCGSSTLESTFNSMNYKVLRGHNDDFIYPRHPINVRYSSMKDLIGKQKKEKIYIIDSYRNPVERLLSRFFQIACMLIKNTKSIYDLKLINYYIMNILSLNQENHPLDLEYPVLRDIPWEGRYISKTIDRFTFVKLRFFDIDNWDQYLTEIFGTEIKLVNENISDEKKYYDVYQDLKKDFKISRSYFEKIRNDPIFQKYNSLEEQEKYLNRWSSRVEENSYFFQQLGADFEFRNIPKNFPCDNFRMANPHFSGLSNFDIKIQCELFGNREPGFFRDISKHRPWQC